VANKRARTLGACVEIVHGMQRNLLNVRLTTQNHLWQCTTDVSAPQRDAVTRAARLSSDRSHEILTTRLSEPNETRCMQVMQQTVERMHAVKGM
jgi:hypothetical protein